MNDADAIREAARLNPGLPAHRTSLMSSFTSLEDATLLHVAAEYGNYEAARALIELGADADARAGVDADGIGGQTPLFHTVSWRANRSSPIMRLLVESGADCQVFVKGVHWGKGHQWETTFFDVTPISYAQLGLMPQVHRSEMDVYENVRYLLSSAGRAVPALANVPNLYLRK